MGKARTSQELQVHVTVLQKCVLVPGCAGDGALATPENHGEADDGSKARWLSS